MRPVQPRLLASILLAWTALAPEWAPAQAQSGAQSTFINPSIRASGMGGAGAAVFWDDAPNDWANPALLGGRRGLRYEWGNTRLIPELTSDVYFRSRRITAGAWGVGFSFAGRPFDDVGLDKLDYGLSVATDINGDPIGTFSSFEEIRSIGFGVSFLELYENLVWHSGGDPPALYRYADLSIGHAWKHVLVDLAPAAYTQEGIAGRGESDTADYGLLLRLTPVDSDRSGRVGNGWGRRLDLGFAWSARNYSESQISFIDPNNADPVVEEGRFAVSAHGALSSRPPAAAPGRALWLQETIQPVVSVGATWERSQNSWGPTDFPGHVDRWGGDLTLLQILSGRVGYIDDPRGTIQAVTWGFGVGLHFRGVAGVRYDYASVPQSKYLERLKRHDYSAYVDPLKLWSLLFRGRAE